MKDKQLREALKEAGYLYLYEDGRILPFKKNNADLDQIHKRIDRLGLLHEKLVTALGMIYFNEEIETITTPGRYEKEFKKKSKK